MPHADADLNRSERHWSTQVRLHIQFTDVRCRCNEQEKHMACMCHAGLQQQAAVAGSRIRKNVPVSFWKFVVACRVSNSRKGCSIESVVIGSLSSDKELEGPGGPPAT